MTVEAAASTVVRCSPQEVLELVLDLDRYRQADPKITKVVRPAVLDADGRGTARYWGRLRFTPAAPDTNLVVLARWTDLTFTGAPRQVGRLFMDFEGRFRCEELDDIDEGCRVTHSYRLAFRHPLRWLYEPLVRAWLQREVEGEVERLRRLLEGSG